MQSSKQTSSFKLLCLLLLGILVPFYFPWLARQWSFYRSDLTFYFQPFSNFIAEAYRQGRLPLWNPYLYCGMAQFAVPSPGPFYPPAFLFVLMPFSQALAAYMLVHQLIAGVGAFLLVASLGWGGTAAVVAGVAIALSGFMFALIYNYTLVASACWMPLLLWSVRRIDGRFNRANVGNMFACALAMGLMVSAGRPEISVPAALIVGAYVLCSAVANFMQDRVWKAALQPLALRVVSLGLGGALAAPVIFPAMEWVKLSPRAHGLDLIWVLMWSANWYDCVMMVLAQPLGDLTRLGNPFLNMAASRANAIPYLTSTYIGPVVFSLAFWSLGDKNWRWKWAVLFVFLGSLVMALGTYTPVAPFVSKLSPMFSSFRYPVKLMFFPVACVVFLAARGTYVALEKQVSRWASLVCAVIWSTLVVAGIVFLLVPGLHYMTTHLPWANKTINLADMLAAQMAFGRSMIVTGVVGLATFAAYWLYRSEKLTRESFSVLIVGALCGTLVVPAVAYSRKGAAGNFYDRPDPWAAQLQQLTDGKAGGASFKTRITSLAFDPLTPGLTFLKEQNIDFQKGFYLYARQFCLQNANVDWHIPYSFGYEAAEVGQFKDLFSNALGRSTQNRAHDPDAVEGDEPIARFCYLTASSHAITQSFRNKLDNKVEPLDEQFFKLVKDDPDMNVRLYEVKQRLPRAYFATAIKWNVSWNSFYADMMDTDSDDLVTHTYMESAPEPGVGDAVDQHATVDFINDQPESVSLRARTNAPRLLVLADQFYPGWNAFVDGKPAKTLRVNFFARGVVVPAGEHVVDFQFQPMSLWLGFGCTGAILLLFLATYLFCERRRPELTSEPLTSQSLS